MTVEVQKSATTIIHCKVKNNMTSNMEIESGHPVKRPPINKYALCSALLASLTSVLLGYDIGVMSGANIFIQRDLKINDQQIEVLSGVLSLYSLIGALVAGRTSDWIGRRFTLVVAAIFFFVGSVVMGLAKNYAYLMVGRFIAGIGVGYGMMITPVYNAEIAPASFRGMLTSFGEVFINVGILLGYVSNVAFSKCRLGLGWRLMLGIGVAPAVAIAISVCLMPESPRWLVMQGRLKDAKIVLDKTSDTKTEADSRFADIKSVVDIPEDCHDDIVKVDKKSKGGGVYKEIYMFWKHSPSVRHILIAVVGINFFQQSIGIDAVVMYSNRIFLKAGITSTQGQLLCTVGVGVVKTAFILVATFTLDKTGRRPLLLSTVFAMFVSLVCLGTGLTVVDRSGGHAVTWAVGLSIAAVLAYVASFSVGMGPIVWVYCSEILPLRIRSQGTGLGVAVNRFMSGIIQMRFLSLAKAITIGGAFFLFAGISVLAWFFVFMLLPETRGRPLEDTEKLFGDLNWKKKEKELAARNAAASQ